MSIESKVGAFVLAGLALLGIAIFLLGDFTFQRRYPIYVDFTDVSGLSEDSPVRLSGVDVGKVKKISFQSGKVRAEARIREGVPIYKNSLFQIGSTGIIGSKYLQIDQGKAESGVLQPGEAVQGKEADSIEKSLTKAFNSLQDLLAGLNGDESKQTPMTKNLNATVANVRELTANLNEMLADVKPNVTHAMDRMDSITAKLDSILAKTDQMMAAINQQKGPVGALLHDEKMKNDVKETVSSLKDVAGTAKDVLGRINQFRVYWNYDWRYEHAIRTSRGDIGLKIYPRDERYYYLGGSNLANVNDSNTHGTDYARKNTIDALLGFVWPYADLGVGVIQSGGGARVTVTPFKDVPVLDRLSLMAQGHDFGRNRVVESRRFSKPQYDFGGMFRAHRLIGIGARVEDVQEIPRYQTWVNVSFEDKDIAYLFGMTTFGVAGTKGRSKSK
ncbi:MAG: MCE family protein [Elusimicrobia bacterium]|nr:MCE family protein [Elusimicrobiota bacterium]